MDGYFRQFIQTHPLAHVEWATCLTELEISTLLQTTIFRLVEETTKYLVGERHAKQLRVQLYKTAETLVLEIADGGSSSQLRLSGQPEEPHHLEALQDRIAISGGSSHAEPNAWGGTTLHAEWPIAEI